VDDARPEPSPVGVTLPDSGPREIARLTDELLPALVARLAVSSLGEIEVAQDGWRVRLRRAPTLPEPKTATRRGHAPVSGASVMLTRDARRHAATSPAVGYFSAHKVAAVGHSVSAGDVLGWVDVLGVRQDVVAPSDGIVGRILAEPGEAVEYGQELIRIDMPASAANAAADAAAADGPAPVVERDATSSLSGPRTGALD
jgi:biotin carboxyl carrier protein